MSANEKRLQEILIKLREPFEELLQLVSNESQTA